jgi:5-methylcytosine-specific restriction endonuclease McrA
MATKNTLRERLDSGEFRWLLYLAVGLMGVGLVLIALGLTVVPGPLLLVGLLPLGGGFWLFRAYFPKTKTIIRRRVPRAVRDEVWRAYNGNKLDGRCYVCPQEIAYASFELAHDIPLSEGGTDAIENLRPICGKCNKAMGTMRLEDYRLKYYPNVEPLKRARRRRAVRKTRETDSQPSG